MQKMKAPVKNTAPKRKTVKERGNSQKIVAQVHSALNEEKIREKALDLYLQRMEYGVHGTAEEDWIEAEMILRSSAE